jgi:hypothetical protein
MMQLGLLGAIADARPERFCHIVLDNRIYAVSGAQPVPASETFDWVAIALAAGYPRAEACETPSQLQRALHSPAPGPRMIVARCEPTRPDYPPGSFAVDAAREGMRVRDALLSVCDRSAR